jgi:hypothetical protein
MNETELSEYCRRRGLYRGGVIIPFLVAGFLDFTRQVSVWLRLPLAHGGCYSADAHVRAFIVVSP